MSILGVILSLMHYPFFFSLEINPSINDIKNAYNNVEKWAKPEKAPFSINFAAMRPVIYKEPKGVVLVVSPFNYPLWLSLPVIVRTILAAGWIRANVFVTCYR